jgi:Rrf2 family nitric oxide-sensitive transcriptional repressor
MFSNTAEYALRAAVYLATASEGLRTSQFIAEATKVPAGYLSKILKDLADAGIVVSQRGPNGGFSLARPADEITALEVVNAVDPIVRIRKCPLGLPAHADCLCPLHQKLDDAIAVIERALASSTIAEMVDTARGTNKACAFPAAAPAPVKPTVKGKPVGRKKRTGAAR